MMSLDYSYFSPAHYSELLVRSFVYARIIKVRSKYGFLVAAIICADASIKLDSGPINQHQSLAQVDSLDYSCTPDDSATPLM